MGKISDLDSITKSYILEPFLRQAAACLKSKPHAKDIQIECIYCGEKKPKGTLFLSNNNNWSYICWKANCQCANHAISAEKWLKQADPQLYSNYIDELKKAAGTSSNEDLRQKAMDSRKKADEAAKLELERRIKEDIESTRFFKKITRKGTWQKAALEFCKRRMIPVEICKDFYYADEGKYKGRIIIPFRNANNEIEFFQGRSLDPASEVRYMSKVGNTALYNYDFLDRTKPVIVLEGPIDSMFIENATATVGAGSSANLDQKLDGLNCYYLFDNDDAGRKKAGQKVAEKQYVFMWSKFQEAYMLPDKIKDINEAVIYLNKKEKFKFEDLEPFFTNIRDYYLTFL